MALIFDGREIFVNEMRDDDGWDDDDIEGQELDSQIIFDDELDNLPD